MGNERIKLTDDVRDAILKLADSNPGAATVCAELYKQGPSIDPDNFAGGLGQLVNLDSFGIYGPDIWMLFKDVCKQNLVHMVAILRAVQLGFISRESLHHATQNYGDGIHVKAQFAAVCDRLPNFAKANALDAEMVA